MAINIVDADTNEQRVYMTLQELAEDLAPLIAQQLDEGGPEVEVESTVLAAVEGAEAITNVIPRAAVEPLVQAKTRGELIEKLGELLAPYGITIAEA